MINFEALWAYIQGSKIFKLINNLDFQQAIRECTEEACKKLQNDAHIKSTAFTPHGIPHCLDILKIINELFYSENITEIEWVCLLVAVAWHDVGMHGDVVTDKERKNHAAKAAEECVEFIRKNNAGRVLTENLQNCICEIIRGHSGKSLFHIATKKECECNQVRVRGLAAILRFADELDVCSDRLVGEKQLYSPLPISDGETEREKLNREYSFACWEQCAVFLMPKRGETGIKLRVSIQNVKARLDKQYRLGEKEIYNSIYDLIERHLKKVEQSFYEDRVKDVFDVEDFGFDWLKDIKLISVDESIPDREIDFIKKKIGGLKHNSNAIDMYQARTLLRNAVQNRALRSESSFFRSGVSNCELEGEKINTYRLIQHDEENIIPQIVFKAFGGIKDKICWEQENVLILGVDDLGWILASSLAFMFNIPFEMIISRHHKEYAETKFLERTKKIKDSLKGKDILIVIDTIYTFTTIVDIIKEYSIPQDKIAGIVCLFDRKPYPQEADSLYQSLKSKKRIFAVIDDDKVRYV